MSGKEKPPGNGADHIGPVVSTIDRQIVPECRKRSEIGLKALRADALRSRDLRAGTVSSHAIRQGILRTEGTLLPHSASCT
jgi:hypothetical protein